MDEWIVVEIVFKTILIYNRQSYLTDDTVRSEQKYMDLLIPEAISRKRSEMEALVSKLQPNFKQRMNICMYISV
jgi:hypothetical protein